MANELMGGMKLIATLSVEFGARPIMGTSTYGATSNNMTGPISDCASAIRFTAAPIASIKAP